MRRGDALRAQTRRAFVKEAALGAAAIASMPHLTAAPAPVKSAIPPHKALYVPGVHGYADRESVAAGEEIRFHVSADQPYRMEVVRLGSDPNSPAQDQAMEAFPPSAGWFQPIHPGSYIHVQNRLTGRLRALTFECWVRPWKLRALGGLITQHEEGSGEGIGLFLTPDLQPLARIGALAATANARLKQNVWAHLALVVEAGAARVFVDGVPSLGLEFERVSFPAVPLRIGASDAQGEAGNFLDADIAMPAVYNRALPAEEIRARVNARGLQAPREGLLGCWPLDEERGSKVRDFSRHRRHGEIINSATWMIGGSSYDSEAPRFNDYAPAADPRRGHGLRLASDDLYDCRWASTQQWKVPPGARQGIYAARIHFSKETEAFVYHITFVVTRGKKARPAPLLVLCSTNTWRAYNAAAFARNQPGIRHIAGTNGMPNSDGEPPAFSFYRAHAAGQGTFQMGLRVPWPAAGPYIRYGDRTDYSHLSRAERFTHAWLEKAGYEFDLITDTDLHSNPGVLKGYRAFIIAGHSEYWSVPMYKGLETYLAGGGHVLCLSGNSLFWRVSYDDEMALLECRKVDAPGEQLPPSRRGECWHSADGQRGGLLRECGYPGWKLVGLETLGWNDQNDPRQFGPYRVEDPDHFLFRTPRPLGLKKGDKFGEAPDGGLPRANGHEIDVRLSTLERLQQKPPPPGAAHPQDPAGMRLLASGIIPWKIGGAAFDYFFRPIKPENDQGGEVIFWERPEGGKVFNAGSIGSGWALWADPRFQGLVQNALSHFGVEPRS